MCCSGLRVAIGRNEKNEFTSKKEVISSPFPHLKPFEHAVLPPRSSHRRPVTWLGIYMYAAYCPRFFRGGSDLSMQALCFASGGRSSWYAGVMFAATNLVNVHTETE